MWLKIIAVGIGGFGGAVARFLIDGWVNHFTTGQLPYGTLTVNVLGSLLLGLLGTLWFESGVVTSEVRLLVLTGFLGSLTTFSTFSYESFQLLVDGQPRLFFTNITANVVVCLLFVWLGHFMVKWT